MHTSHRLPDVFPDISVPTLLVVCDTHHCRFVDVGGHALVMSSALRSKEPSYSDREGQTRSPAAMGKGGGVSGLTEVDQVEGNRLHEFSNIVSTHLNHLIEMQKIREVYIAAPDKFLAELKKHLSKHTLSLVQSFIDGNFMHESDRDIFLRFRPDLVASVQALRDQENYSSKKHLPK